MSEAWRWWAEEPESDVLRESCAQEYLLHLAEVSREFYAEKGAGPVGFLFKSTGDVVMTTDLANSPQKFWPLILTTLAVREEACFYVIITEATVAVLKDEAAAKAVIQTAEGVSKIEGAREGLLLILHEGPAVTRQMLFMPRNAAGELGEIEIPTPTESFN